MHPWRGRGRLGPGRGRRPTDVAAARTEECTSTPGFGLHQPGPRLGPMLLLEDDVPGRHLLRLRRNTSPSARHGRKTNEFVAISRRHAFSRPSEYILLSPSANRSSPPGSFAGRVAPRAASRPPTFRRVRSDRVVIPGVDGTINARGGHPAEEWCPSGEDECWRGNLCSFVSSGSRARRAGRAGRGPARPALRPAIRAREDRGIPNLSRRDPAPLSPRGATQIARYLQRSARLSAHSPRAMINPEGAPPPAGASGSRRPRLSSP
jgi:hypothetical protein